MKKALVWETLATVSGGQKMTLTVLDMLSGQYEFCCLIPKEGMLSEELRKRNIPYVLMGDQTLPTGVKGWQVAFRYGWMSIKNVCKSLRVIRKFKPDVLYCPGPAALPWSAICGTLSGRPVIWHLHHIFLDGATKKLLNLCGKWKSVRTIIAVSNCVGDQIVNEKAHRKIKVLYNPVDVEKYANGNPERILAEVEMALGRPMLRDDELVIGHIALIQESKKQTFTLEVIHALREKGYDVVGLFAGECRDPQYMEMIQKTMKQFGLEQFVAFLGRRNDIPDLLKLVDVLIIPSSFEGFPLAGLEAAAAGVPVAACDVGGAKEFVQVSGDGVSFQEDNVSAAASGIIQCQERKDEYGIKGVSFAEMQSAIEFRQKISDCFQQNELCHKTDEITLC